MTELEVFAPAWTERLAEELNADLEYRRAAADWRGVLGLALAAPDGGRRTALLDLEAGRCMRTANDPEACPPDYLIEADAATWKRVLAGELEPMWGLMSGKLKLAHGSLAELAPQAASALRIVKCAQKIDAVFPETTPKEAGDALEP